MGYELLDEDLTESTRWMFGSKDSKLLLITVLSKCHGSHICRVPIPVLFRLAGLTESEGEAALSELEKPDPNSRCQAEEGRTVVQVQDEVGKGLFLPSYRERRNRYMTKNRVAELRRREEEKARNAASPSVTPGNGEFDLAGAGAGAAAGEKKEGGRARASRRASPAPFVPPSEEDVRNYVEAEKLGPFDVAVFMDFYRSKGWLVGKNPMKDWKAAVRNAARKGWTLETKSKEPTPTGNPKVRSFAPEELARVFGPKPEES